MKIKNIIRLLYTMCFLFSNFFLFSQEYRNSGFSKPMNLPFKLAGSFGEPRKDHFHSGIDIKTNGVEGEPVFAIGDGYISRIRVSPYGYGKAIYITHTNGFTSVYGHLSKFYDAIEKYIHAQHYLLKKSELDLTLDAKLFSVKQNDIIAFSGNTGGSTAPHLHFEIRNTKTEHALNPLDFYPSNFYVDTIPPQLNRIKIISLNDDGVYYSISDSFRLKKENNIYKPFDSILLRNESKILISLEGFDKQDNSENKNGIKTIVIYKDDSVVFKYNLDDVDFSSTRMCNAFIDYNEMMNNNGYFYNCYKLKGNQLNYYSSNGLLSLPEGENRFRIYCFDYNNNVSEIRLNILRDGDMATALAINQDSNVVSKSVSFIKEDSILNSSFKIKFPAYSLYDNILLEVAKVNISQITYAVSNSQQLVPLHKPAKIEFKSYIKKNRNKIVVVRQDNNGKETALKTTFDKTKFYADTKELGTFYLKYDTTKAEIQILNLNYEILNKKMQAKISDNLSGIDTYNGYIDNKWVNFYYYAKNDVIQYNFDEYCTKGEHLLKIIVSDKVGNKTTVQQKFIY